MSKSYYECRDELTRVISHHNGNDENLLIEIEAPDSITLSVSMDEKGTQRSRIILTFDEFEDVIKEYKKFCQAQAAVKASV